jgi:CHAD domain-containing protein
MKTVEHKIEAWLSQQARRLFVAAPDFGDVETVHRMRVASRRLRIGLQFLGVRSVPSLRRLGRTLGAVRVLDVNLALLREAPMRCPSLEQQLVRERRKRFAALRALYRKTKPVARWRGEADARSALAELHRVLQKRLKQFDKTGSSAAFHGLRIAAKKYRYGLEIVGATKAVKPVKRLQELMGDCHDVEVLMERLPAGPLKEYFAREHRRRYKAVEKFLDGRRHWVKKVRLDNE